MGERVKGALYQDCMAYGALRAPQPSIGARKKVAIANPNFLGLIKNFLCKSALVYSSLRIKMLYNAELWKDLKFKGV